VVLRFVGKIYPILKGKNCDFPIVQRSKVIVLPCKYEEAFEWDLTSSALVQDWWSTTSTGDKPNPRNVSLNMFSSSAGWRILRLKTNPYSANGRSSY
jgi:hypothetical protein